MQNYKQYLPAAEIVKPVYAKVAGYVGSVDTFALGNAIIELGGGRRILGQELDLSVGLADVASIGSQVSSDQPLAMIHAANTESAERAAKMLIDAYSIGEEKPTQTAVIKKTMTAE